jgi:hypothetical protein
MDDYSASMDLRGEGRVGWASAGPVPIWFDIAQDLTERWVHQMQMREAVDRVDSYSARYLSVVLRTFVWALPHQYRVEAPRGTAVQIDLGVGGTWSLVSEGSARWTLDEQGVAEPDAHAEFSGDAAWRWLTAAEVPAHGVTLGGPSELCAPLLAVRGVLA